jgi:hypothetical protein
MVQERPLPVNTTRHLPLQTLQLKELSFGIDSVKKTTALEIFLDDTYIRSVLCVQNIRLSSN